MKFEEIIGKLYPQRAKSLEADKLDKLWDNPNYIFEVKYDGDRRLVYFTSNGNINTSRSKSADNGLPVVKTDNVPHIRDLDIPELYGTIFDGEFTHPRGFQEGVRKIMGCLAPKAIERQNEWGLIEYRIFDIIAYKGEFLHDKTLLQRKAILNEVYDKHFQDVPFINLVEQCFGNKEELLQKLDDIIKEDGEGMVAKDTNSKYRISTEKCQSPLKNAWIKVKREFNGDFVVTGFEEPTKEYTGEHLDTHQYWENDIPVTEFYAKGWIGAIKFSEYENGVLVERGSVSGLTKELRAQISANPDSYIGLVMELDAMQRTKDKALRQPVFKRFRNDKEPTDCQYENQKG